MNFRFISVRARLKSFGELVFRYPALVSEQYPSLLRGALSSSISIVARLSIRTIDIWSGLGIRGICANIEEITE